MMARVLRLACLAALCATASCQPHGDVGTACRAAGAQPALIAQLLFGLTRPGGGAITPGEWQGFLDANVTPRFPAGLTVLDGAGQWTGRAGRLTRQPAKLVLVVTPDTPQAIDGFAAIRAEYRAAFAQDSVGLVLAPGCASF